MPIQAQAWDEFWRAIDGDLDLDEPVDDAQRQTNLPASLSIGSEAFGLRSTIGSLVEIVGLKRVDLDEIIDEARRGTLSSSVQVHVGAKIVEFPIENLNVVHELSADDDAELTLAAADESAKDSATNELPVVVYTYESTDGTSVQILCNLSTGDLFLQIL
jgi:hypothetical protein